MVSIGFDVVPIVGFFEVVDVVVVRLATGNADEDDTVIDTGRFDVVIDDEKGEAGCVGVTLLSAK